MYICVGLRNNFWELVLPLNCTFQGLNSGLQIWLQTSLPTYYHLTGPIVCAEHSNSVCNVGLLHLFKKPLTKSCYFKLKI